MAIGCFGRARVVTPKIEPSGLTEAKPWEHVVRFLFGGLVTAGAGLIAHRWGPTIGGLFLAFPAILPASLTLVKRHDGRSKAVDDARGARIGALALVLFAAGVWLGAGAWPMPILLASVTLLWILVSIGVWAVVYGRQR
jgi:hypothetical protein